MSATSGVRRLVVMVLGAAALPLLTAPPAAAAVNVICVAPASGSCDQNVATIPLAIAAAGSNAVDDLIRLGAATYSDGPYQLDGTAHGLVLDGAGEGSTFITLPVSTGQTYIFASGATVQDLTITMNPTNSASDTGLSLGNAGVADHVTVDGTGTANAAGVQAGTSTMTHVTVLMPPDSASADRGIYSAGSNTVSDAVISGGPAFELSDPNTTDHLSRVSIRSDIAGVQTDGGSVVIDDAVIDLGSGVGAIGLGAVNTNGGTNLTAIDANHVTIVGGGGGSRGAWAYAASQNGKQNSAVTVTNSIIRGPQTSLVADAGNNGSQGGKSSATLNVSYTDFQTTGGTIDPATGTGGVVQGTGNLVDIDPAFVSASDRRLTAGSPVVDQGDPAPGGPALDLDGQPRVQDGDLNGTAVRDMGAYELGDTTPPDTTIDSGPSGPTGDSTPTFTFSSTEPGSSFVCQVDGGSESACTSPLTTQPLADGSHTLAVSATDLAGNSDLSPAARQWIVDTIPPDTTISSGPTGLTSDATPTFAFSSEAGATFTCKIDSGPEADCTSPFTPPNVTDGPHTFTVRARDAAQNVDGTPATRGFTVDTTPPDTTFTKKPAKKSTKAKAKFAFASSEAGSTFECQLDGKAWAACPATYKVKVKVGKHTLLVRATDAAGHVDATPARCKFKRVKRA